MAAALTGLDAMSSSRGNQASSGESTHGHHLPLAGSTARLRLAISSKKSPGAKHAGPGDGDDSTITRGGPIWRLLPTGSNQDHGFTAA
jgi:hypothetical protein